MLMGLLAASTLTSGSPLKGIASVVVGLIFGVVGTDVNSGVARFDFGIPELQDGIALVALAMGLFGITDVLANAANLGEGTLLTKGIGGQSVRPGKGEIRKAMPSIARGSVIGSALGILPGAGGTMASFMSYATEKKASRTPELFGRGAMEGVSGRCCDGAHVGCPDDSQHHAGASVDGGIPRDVLGTAGQLLAG
jgi:TctA family transporter